MVNPPGTFQSTDNSKKKLFPIAGANIAILALE
jgi:hypothetical protein